MIDTKGFVYKLNVRSKSIETHDSDYIVTIESDEKFDEGGIYGIVTHTIPGENRTNFSFPGRKDRISIQKGVTTLRKQILHISNAIEYINKVSLRRTIEDGQLECPHNDRRDVIVDFVPGSLISYVKIQEICLYCSEKFGEGRWIVQKYAEEENTENIKKKLKDLIKEADQKNQNQYIIKDTYDGPAYYR